MRWEDVTAEHSVWMVRGEETQELCLTAHSLLTVQQVSLIEDLECGISPRGFRREPHWNLDKLESRLRTTLTSYGKSAKFPLVSLDSVDSLVISCWQPPTCKQSPIHKFCPALEFCPMFQRVGLTKESRIPRIQDQLCSQRRCQH